VRKKTRYIQNCFHINKVGNQFSRINEAQQSAAPASPITRRAVDETALIILIDNQPFLNHLLLCVDSTLGGL
jgi:hypothetical protein